MVRNLYPPHMQMIHIHLIYIHNFMEFISLGAYLHIQKGQPSHKKKKYNAETYKVKYENKALLSNLDIG